MDPGRGCHAPLGRLHPTGSLLVLVAVTGIAHEVVIHIPLEWVRGHSQG